MERRKEREREKERERGEKSTGYQTRNRFIKRDARNCEYTLERRSKVAGWEGWNGDTEYVLRTNFLEKSGKAPFAKRVKKAVPEAK